MFSPGNPAALRRSARVRRAPGVHHRVEVADQEQDLRRVGKRREVDLLLRIAERRREDAHDRIGHRQLLLARDGSVLDGQAASTRVADHEHRQVVEIDALRGGPDPVRDELHRLGLVLHFVARVEDDAPPGDEVLDPGQVVVRLGFVRAALAVEVDDEVLRLPGRAVDPDSRGALADRPLGGCRSQGGLVLPAAAEHQQEQRQSKQAGAEPHDFFDARRLGPVS